MNGASAVAQDVLFACRERKTIDRIKIKAAVLGEQGQHMVEEADAAVYCAFACTIEVEGQADVRFFGGACDLSGSHTVSSMTSLMFWSRISICSLVPTVMRL